MKTFHLIVPCDMTQKLDLSLTHVQYIYKKRELYHEPPSKYHQAIEIINLLILLLFYSYPGPCLSILCYFEVNLLCHVILYVILLHILIHISKRQKLLFL